MAQNIPYIKSAAMANPVTSKTAPKSKVQEEIKKQKDFLFKVILTEMKMQNPLESSQNQGDKFSRNFAEIAKLDQLSIEQEEMSKMSSYTNLMLTNSMVGKSVFIANDRLNFSGDGQGKLTYSVADSDRFGPEDTAYLLIYDQRGHPVADKALTSASGVPGTHSLNVTLSPDEIEEIKSAYPDMQGVLVNLAVKRKEGQVSRMQTYGVNTVTGVLLGDDGESIIITADGTHSNLASIKGFGSA